MESAIFELLEAIVDLVVLMLFDARKSMERHFFTTMLVTSSDSIFRATQFQPWRKVLRTMLFVCYVILTNDTTLLQNMRFDK